MCVSRQSYPEAYSSSKSGWSSHSDYYAGYYSGQYDYGGKFRSLNGQPLVDTPPGQWRSRAHTSPSGRSLGGPLPRCSL